jgi:FkbM family methyltransferase
MELRPPRFIVEPERLNHAEIAFCEQFLQGKRPRYVFGCNAWAQSIAEQVAIDGFVDDVVPDKLFCGKPVMRSVNVPKDALVVSAVVLGRPLTALSRIREQGLAGIDYFAFKKYAGLGLADVLFLDDFKRDFDVNRHRYEWLFSRLEDAESRRILSKLINFRLSRDLKFMDGFVDAQDRQYFEPFLALRGAGETFLDVGCYDGFTSLEFIKRCPDYRDIHVFEPETANMAKVKSRLAKCRNIHFHQYGVSDRPQTLRFKSAGSGSVVSDEGKSSIEVKRIDDMIVSAYSFLKMDIEGGEMAALKGASQTIVKYHPRLAVAVYHKADDMWRIAEQVLESRDDYHLYLRHYTEGVTETVMFFVPR